MLSHDFSRLIGAGIQSTAEQTIILDLLVFAD
jgi:hypothetical protein